MTTTMLRTISKRSESDSKRSGKGKTVVRKIFMALALPLILLTLWWIGSAGSTNYLNPPLSVILSEFWPTWFGGETFGESRFVQDVLPSVNRILIGFGIALVVGISLGVLLGTFKKVRATVEPVLEFFRAIPPPVLVPIFMLFMGIGNEMKIAVIAIGALWPILLNTIEGVRGIDTVLKDTSRSYRFTARGKLLKLTLPGASPQIITGARQSLSIAIILMVISEMFAAMDGLGFTIVQFQRSFAIPQMWGGVILLGLIGVVLATVFRWISNFILRWYYGYLSAQRGGA